ncbi:Hypothetical protein, putative [Bodo saltans]|uniref:Uncharacterized protein n=1 Tax=Bodo saltans TaxID=75058 RepID=A0A0S4IWV7_BODSA|nr:Hypothetical protein, putative [Bodo saltans]|eukprot:CUG06228.1 Hypothetical protein, putative [Bodo saltans]
MGSSLCTCHLEQPALRPPRLRNRSLLSNSTNPSTSVRTPLHHSSNNNNNPHTVIQLASPPQTPHVPLNIPVQPSTTVRIPQPAFPQHPHHAPQPRRQLLVLHHDEAPMLVSAASSLSAGGVAAMRAAATSASGLEDEEDSSAASDCLILVRPPAAMFAAQAKLEEHIAQHQLAMAVDNPLKLPPAYGSGVGTTISAQPPGHVATRGHLLLHEAVQRHSTESSSRHLSTTSSLADRLDAEEEEQQPDEQEQNQQQHHPLSVAVEQKEGTFQKPTAERCDDGTARWVAIATMLSHGGLEQQELPGHVPSVDGKR